MIGKIIGISGPTVEVEIEGLSLYERVYLGHQMLTGEVIAVKHNRAIIQAYENTKGLSTGEPVKKTETPLTVKLGPGLLSEMYDGLQRPLKRLKEDSGTFLTSLKEIHPIDYTKVWRFYPLKKKGDVVHHGEIIGYVYEGKFKHFIASNFKGKLKNIVNGNYSLNEPIGELEDGTMLMGCHEWPVRNARPYKRKLPPTEPLITGQRCVDFLFPVPKGGTVILPGGFGTGKTILEQSIAKFANVDIVVYVGCGERGNEIAELIADFSYLSDPWTNSRLMDRTILVVNTSNMPVVAREASIYTAVTMAEYYRDMGYHVLLLADSLSRWAEALREISSSMEEMPGEEGYPTYMASRLSSFFERSGIVESLNGKIGSLSMILSISPPGGDFTEPVTQACLKNTGAFLMLDTALANKRHFPAVNYFQSYSLYEQDVIYYFKEQIDPEWETLINRCKEILQIEEKLKEIAEIVGYEGLQDRDRLIMYIAEKIRRDFLCQNAYSEDAFSRPEDTFLKIKSIIKSYDDALEKLDKGISFDSLKL
jgi:V/A-type H+-transporting ATPase subunit A